MFWGLLIKLVPHRFTVEASCLADEDSLEDVVDPGVVVGVAAAGTAAAIVAAAVVTVAAAAVLDLLLLLAAFAGWLVSLGCNQGLV